ncbi:hypothetical protein BpHYR1_014918 [Brachionus plicatilis]|uniref:Uncharacterized protein n=1 Tax=Brachionus plicatilis TaxID=10195 RepID=A0A3M7Q6L2_BRAPC|nr:hypothetical protein BpHYR1_014918 [Brachionus plicatilis]
MKIFLSFNFFSQKCRIFLFYYKLTGFGYMKPSSEFLNIKCHFFSKRNKFKNFENQKLKIELQTSKEKNEILLEDLKVINKKFVELEQQKRILEIDIKYLENQNQNVHYKTQNQFLPLHHENLYLNAEYEFELNFLKFGWGYP